MPRIWWYGYDQFWIVRESVGASTLTHTCASCIIVNFVPIIYWLHPSELAMPDSYSLSYVWWQCFRSAQVLNPLDYRQVHVRQKKQIHLASCSTWGLVACSLNARCFTPNIRECFYSRMVFALHYTFDQSPNLHLLCSPGNDTDYVRKSSISKNVFYIISPAAVYFFAVDAITL